MLSHFVIHFPLILFLAHLYLTLSVILDHISLPHFGTRLLLCSYVLVYLCSCKNLSLCFCVWGDTHTNSLAILSTHMQLALKFSYKKKKKMTKNDVRKWSSLIWSQRLLFLRVIQAENFLGRSKRAKKGNCSN